MDNVNKRYYWIKLKTDFFDQDKIDFLMGQENGAEYVVIYQMLMLKTAQQSGYLATQMAEIMIPYDVKKIARDTKYFDYDTVAIALELFKKLGLIYEEDNHIFKLANAEEMVGSETKWAEKKRIYRENQVRQIEGQKKDNVREEIELDKDKDIDKDKEEDINNISPPKEPEKPQKPEKHKYGEYKHVLLTDEEYKKLHQDYSNADELITYLDEYIEMKGYKANSHNLAIRKWVTKAVAKEKAEDSRRHEFKEPSYDDSNNIKATSDELEALKRMRGESNNKTYNHIVFHEPKYDDSNNVQATPEMIEAFDKMRRGEI